MFQPQYSLTNHLFNNVATCERLYGQVEALRLPKQLELNLKRNNLIESAYASNRIEGNPMTLPEVTNLILNDRMPSNRDEKEIANYFAMLEKLDSYAQKPFSAKLVTDLHQELFAHFEEGAGRLRNEIVAVSRYTREENGKVKLNIKHMPPYHAKTEIRQALEELLSWAKQQTELPVVVKAGIFHHHFVYIHPFLDGNGRICRMLTALLFIKAGYRINRYFILDDYYDIDRNQYSDMLHSADDGDKTQWLEYFSDGVKYSLQSALAKAQTSLQTLHIAQRPSTKERTVLDIMMKYPETTSTEIAGQLQVSRQQAHNLLSGLVEKGLIERKGSTKSSYYVLK
ncbi:Fic family protein [Candidatus Beckwithbacteria bacterium]|nr:Fic family protein [Candidatus Beckwithbacteria bacterium]